MTSSGARLQNSGGGLPSHGLKHRPAAIHLIFAEFLSRQWGVPQCVAAELRAVDVRSSHQFEEEIGAASSENGIFIAKIEFSVRTGRENNFRQVSHCAKCPGARPGSLTARSWSRNSSPVRCRTKIIKTKIGGGTLLKYKLTLLVVTVAFTAVLAARPQQPVPLPPQDPQPIIACKPPIPRCLHTQRFDPNTCRCVPLSE